MLSLNDKSITVSQIKQILHTFNLPNCSIGYKNPAANKLFIHDGYIQRWVPTTTDSGKVELVPERIEPYKYNKEYLNFTTNLPIRNMLYDRETHRYLGRYLRFIRDFRGVNLMSMYNCFDGEIFLNDLICVKRNSEVTEDTPVDQLDDKYVVRFKNGYQGNNVFAIPVDFQKLTMRVSAGNVGYVCLYIDDKEYDGNTAIADLNQKLAKYTLQKIYANELIYLDLPELLINRCSFNSSLLNELLGFIAENISNLKLLLKVVEDTAINITVLEGEYSIDRMSLKKYFLMQPFEEAYMPLIVKHTPPPEATIDSDSAFILTKDISSSGDSETYSILLIKYFVDPTEGTLFDNPLNLRQSGFSVSPQLLLTNDAAKHQYLIGDRLFEYLSGNAICPLSESYDIARLQKGLMRSNIGRDYVRYADRFRGTKYVTGIWSPIDLHAIRGIIADNNSYFINAYDVLGYVDKDVEKLLGDVLNG